MTKKRRLILEVIEHSDYIIDSALEGEKGENRFKSASSPEIIYSVFLSICLMHFYMSKNQFQSILQRKKRSYHES
jgi:hypothetical protein